MIVWRPLLSPNSIAPTFPAKMSRACHGKVSEFWRHVEMVWKSLWQVRDKFVLVEIGNEHDTTNGLWHVKGKARGKFFPGRATFGGPTVAQTYNIHQKAPFKTENKMQNFTSQTVPARMFPRAPLWLSTFLTGRSGEFAECPASCDVFIAVVSGKFGVMEFGL